MLTSRIDVLDKGWVELQDMMGDDLAIVNAARVSFLGESKGDEADARLLHYLMKHRHTSPFEQVVFKFRICAPLVVWLHLMRHRTASMNMESLRYTEAKAEEFYVPKVWRRQAKSNKQASEGQLSEGECEVWSARFLYHVKTGYGLYKHALECGIAREQARVFLPGFAVYYTAIWTMDAHNLMGFLRQRDTPEAQFETREYAKAIHAIFKDKLPITEEAYWLYK